LPPFRPPPHIVIVQMVQMQHHKIHRVEKRKSVQTKFASYNIIVLLKVNI